MTLTTKTTARSSIRIERLQACTARILGTVVLIAAAVAVLAHSLGQDGWQPPVDRWLWMNSNSALAFLLLGALLLRAANSSGTDEQPQLGSIRLLTVVIIAIGAAALLEYALGLDLSIDRWLSRDGASSKAHSDNMPPLSALTLILLGFAFLLDRADDATLSQCLALLAFAIGYLEVLGRLYGAQILFGGHPEMPLATAILALLVSSGLMTARSTTSFIRLVAATTPAGVLLRRLLPVVLFVAPLLDWFQAYLVNRDRALSAALVAVGNVTLLLLLVWWTAHSVQASERRRERAEMDLRRSHEALERSNAELLRFAHVAAHDLQTPLRSIAGFAELLHERFGTQLEDRGREWTRRLVDAATQLQNLVQGLLQYAQLDTQRHAFQPVPMNEVLDRVKDLLIADVHASGATITATELPVVNGNRPLLMRLLLNLLSNSIKYRSEAPPSIQLSAEQQDAEWLFCVRDNGLGIEPTYAERVFEMFERLHTGRQHAGTGIGLAICRRVVQLHGGRIWVESQPGVGSSFFFTLPGLSHEHSLE